MLKLDQDIIRKENFSQYFSSMLQHKHFFKYNNVANIELQHIKLTIYHN